MSSDVDLGLRLKKVGQIAFEKDLIVTTSARRWESKPSRTFYEYTQAYLYAVWLRKAPPFQQIPVR